MIKGKLLIVEILIKNLEN